jgi:Tfp pilus assembly protein PilF
MRRDKIRDIFRRIRTRRVLTALALVAIASVLASCAKETKPAHKRLPKTERREPKNAIRPYEEAPEAAATPARQASDRLVEKGKSFLDDGKLGRAKSTFRDAVNVDSNNGVAYYWLAITQGRLGETDVALGLLDKADALLSRDPDWSEKIGKARKDLGMGPSNHVVPSPVDEAF